MVALQRIAGLPRCARSLWVRENDRENEEGKRNGCGDDSSECMFGCYMFVCSAVHVQYEYNKTFAYVARIFVW